MRFWDVNFFDLSRSTRSSAAYWFWSHKSWGIQHVIVYLIIAIYLPKIRVFVMNQPQFNWACLQMRVYPCTSSRWPFHRENGWKMYWTMGSWWFWVPYFQTNPDVHRMSKSLLTRQRRHWLWRLHAIEIMRIRVRLWPWLLHEENESKRVAWPDSLERMIS